MRVRPVRALSRLSVTDYKNNIDAGKSTSSSSGTDHEVSATHYSQTGYTVAQLNHISNTSMSVHSATPVAEYMRKATASVALISHLIFNLSQLSWNLTTYPFHHPQFQSLMSSEYRLLNFIQMPIDKGAVSAEIFSEGSELCYRIETVSGEINLYHNGPLAGRRPVATIQNLADTGAGARLTVAFHDEEAKLGELLLTTHSEWVY